MKYFYEANAALFAAGSAYLLSRQYWRSNNRLRRPGAEAEPSKEGDLEREIEDQSDHSDGAHGSDPSIAAESSEAIRRFQIDYFLVYALAVAADWLQGPHIYAIYKYEKQLPEKTVAALYAAGFIAGAVSASFAGGLADRHGRRLACLFYCASYALTCLTMLSDNLIILFLGRLCGGVSTTLLFSVFPAWMIAEYHNRGLQNTELHLSSVFSKMTTLSCVVAIVSGILGDALVAYFGSRVWPFLAATACSGGAAFLIVQSWKENYGTQSSATSSSFAGLKSALAIAKDPRVLALGVASAVFEGTMYLVIFFWSAALKSARAHAGSADELPFGLIFSNFMCAMMAGSAIFGLSSHTRQNVTHLLMATLLIVSCCLSAAVLLLEHEMGAFWAICLIELCIGIYFPSMELLKSEVIEDGVRGTAYSVMRVPLNVFVVAAHAMDQEGDEHRKHVFLTCAVLLMVAFGVLKRYSPASGEVGGMAV
ncbi:major facilitator superfamily transporter [Parachaetomium inaequale]|uniref:Molybdate-anion transporter n=1 Tax=Parachaetomium inaequale TaxID=2588326 RepID=A0AAN6SL46_9PEZI|nr:major facilitator superfamily transporter [Parachaetomium inaequale]